MSSSKVCCSPGKCSITGVCKRVQKAPSDRPARVCLGRGFVWDGAPAHRSGRVEWPPGLEPLQLPPYSPELDPVERLFEGLRGEMANRAFEGLEAIREGLTEAQRPYWDRPYWDRPERLARLTGYPWWIEATGSILTS